MTSILQGTTSLTTHSLVSPPTPFSPLPSPPTSPISPATRTATRIRLKASRRQTSMGFVSSPTTLGEGKETTRSVSPSTLKLMIAEAEHPSGTGGGTITPTSASVKAKRRQSSIAYFTPSSPSPWDQRPRLTRTASGSGPPGISRIEGTASNVECLSSTGNGENRGIATPAGPVKRTSLVLSTRTNSNRESVCSSDDVGGREREPLTLVEKHADLLHFIAQKERKCLELRDQLAVHEMELAELKRKWERIVNRGFASGGGECDPPPHLTLNAGLGGVAFDGLKEGVRMIAAGLSDLGGVIQDPEQDENGDPVVKPGYRTGTHAQRESDSSVSASTGIESGRISISSMSSIWDAEHSVDGSGETKTVVTAPSLSRARSVNSSVHKRGSQARSREYSAPPSAYVSSVSASRSRSTSVDLGVPVTSTANPPSVQLPSSPVSVSKPVSSTTGAKPAVPISTSPTASDLAPPSSIPGLTMGGPVSSWVGTMGKKLGDLQKGRTFSKSQKRASVLLADVSHTIASALSPGPTATTPAPALSPRIQSASASPSPASSASSLRTPPPPQLSRSNSQSMASWLEDDEEQTIHAGVMIPDSKPTLVGGTGTPTEKLSSFDDDDWNW